VSSYWRREIEVLAIEIRYLINLCAAGVGKMQRDANFGRIETAMRSHNRTDGTSVAEVLRHVLRGSNVQRSLIV